MTTNEPGPPAPTGPAPRPDAAEYSTRVRSHIGHALSARPRWKHHVTVTSPDPNAPHERAQLVLIEGSTAVHVIGAGALADEARTQLASGAIPGLTLHPTPTGRTDLRDVADLLQAADARGTNRVFNTLAKRTEFTAFEEVAATPVRYLRSINNIGDRMIDTIRQVAVELYGENYPGSDALQVPAARPRSPQHHASSAFITLDASKRAGLARIARHKRYVASVTDDGVITLTPAPGNRAS